MGVRAGTIPPVASFFFFFFFLLITCNINLLCNLVTLLYRTTVEGVMPQLCVE